MREGVRSFWLIFGSISLVTGFLVRSWEFVRIEGYEVTDSYYHFLIGEVLWGEGKNPYLLSVQHEVVRRLFGAEVVGCMPVGVTPLLFVLWWPLFWLPSLSAANVVWISLAVGLLGAAVFPRLFGLIRQREVLTIVAVVAVLLSATVGRSIILGQTSLLASAALLLLFHNREEARGREWSQGVLLALCSVKPQYFLCAMFGLLARRQWRAVLWGGVWGGLAFFGVSFYLGLSWVESYLSSLLNYSGRELPPEYVQSIQPETMNLFRFAFRSALPGWPLREVGNSCCLLLLAAAFAATCSGKSRCAVVLCLSAFLLFSPYFGQYEDLLLLVAVFLVGVNISGVAILPLIANYSVVRPLLGEELLWIAKFLLMLILLVRAFHLDGVKLVGKSRSVLAKEKGV